MRKYIVKHHNDLNAVIMRKWTAEEMNFFFAILSKAKEQGTKTLEFNKYELIEFVNYNLEHNKRFNETFENLANHITQLRYVEKTSNSIEIMPLFARFKAEWTSDYKDMNVSVKLSEEFEYILNRLNANFTTYELVEFTNIRSTYAKTMYRLLKQWRTVGVKEFSIEELRLLLDVPKSYQICDIDRAVISRIKKELSTYFKNLKVKKVKSNKRGNPVLGYEFIWQAEEVKNIPEKKKETKKISVRYVNSDGYRDFSDLVE